MLDSCEMEPNGNSGDNESAAEPVGFSEVTFELEPVAAAYQYETQLDHDELILIGDFGGGTSDFTLAHLGLGENGLVEMPSWVHRG